MRGELDVALATCVDMPEADPDEEVLSAALDRAGISNARLGWNDPEADFSRARMTVLRSTWDYPTSPREFSRWLEETAAVSDLWNPLPAVRWNLHKGYLHQLLGHGIPVVPTELVRAGKGTKLQELGDRHGWPVMVVKPAISANSMKTLRVDESRLARGEAHLRSLTETGDALVQPYLSAVEDYGERALIWIDGELTHAVRKSPRFTGSGEAVSKEPVPISASERELATRIVTLVQDRLETDLLYARLDLAPDEEGRPLVMEVELIEPSLYFRQSPQALQRFVAASERRLRGAREPGC